MGTAGLNSALNSLLASTLAAQGTLASSSAAITGSEPVSQFVDQSQIVDERVDAATAHNTSAQALQIRARPFAEAHDPAQDSEVSHLSGNTILSGAMMFGEAGSEGFLGHSLEEWAARFAITAGIFFLAYAIPAVIKYAKDMHHEAKLISRLKEVDWIGEHASELVFHVSQWEDRPERSYIDSVLDAVASMPIPSSQRWDVLKKFFIERSIAFRSPFYPYASAFWHAEVLAGVSSSMKESGYSPEEVLEIAKALLLDESVEDYLKIDDFVKKHMMPALKVMKDAGFSAEDAASTLRAGAEAMAIKTSTGDDHVITNTLRTLTQSHGFTPQEVRSYLDTVLIPVHRELKQGRQIWMHVPSYDEHIGSILTDNSPLREMLYSILAQAARHSSISSIPLLIREMNSEGMPAIEQLAIIRDKLS